MDDLTFETYGISNEDVAMIFAAYLLGHLAFVSRIGTTKEFRHGPFRKEPNSDENWQLDDSNDYWLHFKDGKARLIARYYSGLEICRVMLQLFKLRFEPYRG